MRAPWWPCLAVAVVLAAEDAAPGDADGQCATGEDESSAFPSGARVFVVGGGGGALEESGEGAVGTVVGGSGRIVHVRFRGGAAVAVPATHLAGLPPLAVGDRVELQQDVSEGRYKGFDMGQVGTVTAVADGSEALEVLPLRGRKPAAQYGSEFLARVAEASSLPAPAEASEDTISVAVDDVVHECYRRGTRAWFQDRACACTPLPDGTRYSGPMCLSTVAADGTPLLPPSPVVAARRGDDASEQVSLQALVASALKSLKAFKEGGRIKLDDAAPELPAPAPPALPTEHYGAKVAWEGKQYDCIAEVGQDELLSLNLLAAAEATLVLTCGFWEPLCSPALAVLNDVTTGGCSTPARGYSARDYSTWDDAVQVLATGAPPKALQKLHIRGTDGPSSRPRLAIFVNGTVGEETGGTFHYNGPTDSLRAVQRFVDRFTKPLHEIPDAAALAAALRAETDDVVLVIASPAAAALPWVTKALRGLAQYAVYVAAEPSVLSEGALAAHGVDIEAAAEAKHVEESTASVLTVFKRVTERRFLRVAYTTDEEAGDATPASADRLFYWTSANAVPVVPELTAENFETEYAKVVQAGAVMVIRNPLEGVDMGWFREAALRCAAEDARARVGGAAARALYTVDPVRFADFLARFPKRRFVVVFPEQKGRPVGLDIVPTPGDAAAAVKTLHTAYPAREVQNFSTPALRAAMRARHGEVLVDGEQTVQLRWAGVLTFTPGLLAEFDEFLPLPWTMGDNAREIEPLCKIDVGCAHETGNLTARGCANSTGVHDFVSMLTFVRTRWCWHCKALLPAWEALVASTKSRTNRIIYSEVVLDDHPPSHWHPGYLEKLQGVPHLELKVWTPNPPCKYKPYQWDERAVKGWSAHHAPRSTSARRSAMPPAMTARTVANLQAWLNEHVPNGVDFHPAATEEQERVAARRQRLRRRARDAAKSHDVDP
eukprot:TRINITY_DN19289_c0_g1_i1.p1 TRINITY_DN19289_c0_g1~~TRINITY_DN19289_c0_g1_i1.p1  ORF type:complete len:946 (+),score=218.67 TRINITY_DN19289_c0_g1_i1:60-2897(+)